MRCNDCNKFVSQEMGDVDDPQLEITYEEADTAASINGEVRIVVVCGECGTELKDYTFEIDVGDIDIPEGHKGDGHSLEVECTGSEGTENYDNPGRPARYQKHLYGVSLQFDVTCECGELKDVSGSWEDSVPAGSMDEC